ncbi:hypothetical protein HZA45_03665 [Candidatus Peregrinibacteria bacterium]|nr:hypothetical protein [Candidatus Peregrinibacteria bacterium]
MMTNESPANGLSLLSRLDRYWIKRPAPGPVLTAHERLICISTEHWIKYVFPSLLYALLMGTSAFFLYLAVLAAPSIHGLSLFFTVAALAVFFLFHHWFFWFLLAESQAHIIVTSRRIVYIHERLLRQEEMVEVSFEKMKTVEARKSNILQIILNYGSLDFESKAKLTRVPHPGTLAMRIEQAMGMI